MVDPQGASLAFSPANPPAPSTAPTGSAAAAILLMLIGEAEAAEVLGRLDPTEVETLGGAMYGVADVSENEINGVLDEFVLRARERTTLGFGAERQIKGMMERALGPDRAGTILGRIAPQAAKGPSLESLKWMEPRAIAGLVESEHPQLIALVLAHLEPPIAADVLQLLDEEIQPQIIHRIAKLGPVTAEALEDVERLLLRPQPNKQQAAPTARRGGTSDAAQIVNNSRKSAEQRILRALQKLDRNLARSIEDEMFVFDNLMALDDKGLGTLLRTVDSDTLVVALKGADKKLQAKMFGCMSSRAAQSIQDAMADKGPMRLAEVQEAQKEVLSIARRLAAEGTISLGKDEDDYV